MSAPITVREVSRNGRDLARFLRVPYPIYRDDPHWVAPLLADLKKVFKDTNPLFEHAEMRLWIAERGGQDVGRIAGILDQNHLAKHADATAFWGFFECEDNPATAAALFEQVSAWARSVGVKRLLGPMNPTTNDECGLLVDGFDRPPVIMMTYNPRYYVPLVEGAGFTKAKDLLAYHFTVTDGPLERLEKIARGLARRNPDITLKPIRRKTIHADLEKVKQVYNAAWEDNWGFVPMTSAELDFMGERLKPLLVENWALLAEDKGVPVGFMLSLPDYNEALAPLKGRLLSPRIFNFLQYMLGWKLPKWGRVLTLGILKDYRQRGIDAMFFAHSLREGLRSGVKEVEVSWMLEDNLMILRPIEVFGGSRYKTYRLYERAL